MKRFNQYLIEQSGDNQLVTEMFFLVSNSATQAHYLHLMSSSYAEHKALDEYYTNVIGLLDSFTEAFIGKFGKMNNTMPVNTKFLTVSELRLWLETNRQSLTDCQELQTIIDDILMLCNSTCYKLENLK